MIFVDGSNFFHTMTDCKGEDFRADVRKLGEILSNGRDLRRIYYYTSEDVPPRKVQKDFQNKLKKLGIEVVIIKKESPKEKGLDIALAIDTVSLCLHGGYDTCILITGDNDYVRLVKYIKSQGKKIEISFFTLSCGKNLMYSGDKYICLDDIIDEVKLEK